MSLKSWGPLLENGEFRLNEFRILRVKKNNIDRLRELNFVFGNAFEDTKSYHSKKPSIRYLQRLIEKPHFIVLVAVARGKVVGGLVAYILEKFEQQRSEVYIYDLAVEKEFRRQGVASGLIKTLQVVAKKAGAYAIFVQADKVDKPAIALYSMFGVREAPYHFDIPVKLK